MVEVVLLWLVVEWVVECEVVDGVGYVRMSAVAVTIVTALKCVSAASPVTVVFAVIIDAGTLAAPPVATHAMLVCASRSHPIVAALVLSQYKSRYHRKQDSKSYPWPGMLMVN